MKLYRRESDLSKDVVSCLRRYGFVVQRIESGSTGRGIPDLFFAGRKQCGWIELKRSRRVFDYKVEGVGWRPGQQSWLSRVHKAGCPCYTLVAYNDCYVLITMDKIYNTDVECQTSDDLVKILIG